MSCKVTEKVKNCDWFGEVDIWIKFWEQMSKLSEVNGKDINHGINWASIPFSDNEE